MIECAFTIDYEIYGNGEGSLRDLIFEPADKLRAIFKKWDARFVIFIEAAELEMIEAEGTDATIGSVKRQIRDFYEEGFELGLHVHPQWYNGRYQNGKWLLDYGEYNLCTLNRERIAQIIDRSIEYLRNLLGVADFTPFSFRAGNWLFQPSQLISKVLSERDIKVDSSVFKGGLKHQYKLDYRRALKNGYCWSFSDDVEVVDAHGKMVELPVYTNLVPFWRMLTRKRVGLQEREPARSLTGKERLLQFLDFLRLRHPMKFDFCRMTAKELQDMLDKEIMKDKKNPALYRPLIAIGHTKDLIDLETVESLLHYLRRQAIPISNFRKMYDKCKFAHP